MDLLELLQDGQVEAFNDARNPRSPPDLFAAELAELDLTGVDLSGAQLDKSDLTGTNLTDASLARASLAGIDGEGLILDGALAMGCRFSGAFMQGAKLDSADISRGNLEEAVLTGSTGEGLRLIGARLKDAKIDGVTWGDVDLSEAQLKGTDFTGSTLAIVRLVDASGPGVIFINATLEKADATNAKLPGAKLSGASLVGAQLSGINLQGADLTGCDLTGADLTRANLTGAIVAGANFAGAKLVDACLDDVDLNGASLGGADLSGVDARALGLDEAALATLAAWGSTFDPDAPVAFDEPAVAVSEGCVGILWTNEEDDDRATVRWMVTAAGKVVASGTLPYAADSVLADAILPASSGFELVLLLDRPTGVFVARHHLGLDGAVGPSRMQALGYRPAVKPLVRGVEGKLTMWGLSQRGPSVVVHREEGEALIVAASHEVATARGIVGLHHPVLLAKGGVVFPVRPSGAPLPVRTPDGFPSNHASAVIDGDRMLAVWTVARKPTGPGGVAISWLGGRGAPEVEMLNKNPAVLGLDARQQGGRVLVAWLELAERGKGIELYVAEIGAGPPYALALPRAEHASVRWVETEGAPAVAVVSAGGTLTVVGLGGEVITRQGG
jgi:uncharacterized protein YjbI with pentapeptide repeats